MKTSNGQKVGQRLGQKLGMMGSVLTAFMASLCCIGPIIFALLGISGAGVVLKFEKYRSVFIVLSILFLGIAFFFTYRKKNTGNCEPGSFCADPRSDRTNKIVLWLATILVAIFISFPNIISLFL